MTKWEAPAPAAIRAVRMEAGLTQREAAEAVGLDSFQRWSEYERGVRSPTWSRWQLFLLVTGQHKKARLTKRR